MQITKLSKFCEKTAFLLDLCVQNGTRELKEYLETPSVQVYILKNADNVTGMICIMETPDSIDLLDIAVHPSYRRQGLGKLLIDEIIKIYNKEVFLEVRASNKGAIAFYETLGFEQISVRKKYYTAPVEDALIYRRKV